MHKKKTKVSDIESSCMNIVWILGYAIGKVIKIQYQFCKGVYDGFNATN